MSLWATGAAHDTLPSWLASPTVAILGFIATVISILQGIASAAKWFADRTEKPSERRQLDIFAAFCVIATVAVLAPLTWLPIQETVAKMGPKWQADLYPPVIFVATLLFAFALINFNFTSHTRAMISLFAGVSVSLAVPTITFDAVSRPVWERWLVSAIPGMAIVFLLLAVLAHAWPRTANAPADESAPEKTAKTAD